MNAFSWGLGIRKRIVAALAESDFKIDQFKELRKEVIANEGIEHAWPYDNAIWAQKMVSDELRKLLE